MTTDTEDHLFDVIYIVGKTYTIQVRAAGEMEAAAEAQRIWGEDPSQFRYNGPYESQLADYAPVDLAS